MTARTRRWRTPLAVGLSVFLVLAGTLAAGAFWTTANSSLPGTVNAASISSTLTGGSSLTTQYKFTGSSSGLTIGMLPYTNTGTAPVAATLAVTGNTGTFAGQVALALWATTLTACETTVPGTATTGTLAAPPSAPASLSSVAPGATVKLCAATKVTTTLAATQGSTITPTFTITGTVGTNWTTTAAQSFTQSVYRVAQTPSISCANSGGTDVALTWPHVAGATSYTLYRSDGTTVAKTVPVTGNPATVSATLTATDLGYVLVGQAGTTVVHITTVDGTYGSTSTQASITIQVQSLLLLLPWLRC